VKVSCYQWGMTGAYLCHRHALVPGPIPLPTLVTMFAACEYSMDPGMWIAEVPILSDALLMPLKGHGIPCDTVSALTLLESAYSL